MDILENITFDNGTCFKLNSQEILMKIDENQKIHALDFGPIVMLSKDDYFVLIAQLNALIKRQQLTRQFIQQYVDSLPPELAPVQHYHFITPETTN